MRIATPADVVYAFLARLPIILLVALVAWAGYAGIQQLELRSEGTSLLVPNAESIPPNEVVAAQERTAADLTAALDSDDPVKMQEALARAEAAGMT
jgi:hypothetical protein